MYVLSTHCVLVEYSPCILLVLTVYLSSTHRVQVGGAHTDDFSPGEFLARRGWRRVGLGELTAVVQRHVGCQEDAVIRQRHVEQL